MAEIHYFDINVAKIYGVNCAVLLQNIHHWIKKNEANGKNFYDGHYWTYNSAKAFTEMFPYLSQKQIETALKKLRDDGIIITGNYNEMKYDRTLWYAITEKGKSILLTGEMEKPKKGNGNHPQGEPIPYNKPDNNPDDKPDNKTKRFTPPTVEEVRTYCIERKNNVNPEQFVDYYTANGWQVGKHKMKDWKASVRTWERNSFSNGNKQNQNVGANGVKLDGRKTDELDHILK